MVGGRALEVPARGVVLGRQPGPAGIVVEDPSVSRRHTLVRRTGTGVVVADLGSTNGTVVVRGGVREDVAGDGTPASHGDLIMTAGGVLLAEVAGKGPGDPP